MLDKPNKVTPDIDVFESEARVKLRSVMHARMNEGISRTVLKKILVDAGGNTIMDIAEERIYKVIEKLERVKAL